MQLLYPEPHPYFGRVIGSHEDLQRASLDDVREFFRTYYAPDNARSPSSATSAPRR